MLRDEAVEKLPMKDMGLCFLICNSTDKRKVSSKERDRLYMYILRNAPKDATLHAQQVAEKMVEDMRQKLFSMRSTKEAMYKLSEADRLMQYGYHDCINEMLMWTKKLSHD